MYTKLLDVSRYVGQITKIQCFCKSKPCDRIHTQKKKKKLINCQKVIEWTK